VDADGHEKLDPEELRETAAGLSRMGLSNCDPKGFDWEAAAQAYSSTRDALAAACGAGKTGDPTKRTWEDYVATFVAGGADFVSFGIGGRVRGESDIVHKESWVYGAGEVAGFAVTLGAGAAAKGIFRAPVAAAPTTGAAVAVGARTAGTGAGSVGVVGVRQGAAVAGRVGPKGMSVIAGADTPVHSGEAIFEGMANAMHNERYMAYVSQRLVQTAAEREAAVAFTMRTGLGSGAAAVIQRIAQEADAIFGPMILP
jgi:hypothetical protein